MKFMDPILNKPHDDSYSTGAHSEGTVACGGNHEHNAEETKCNCGHEHSHDEAQCNCGHEHSHDEAQCNCGHEHSHDKAQCDGGHKHRSSDNVTPAVSDLSNRKVYILQNLGCANCAAKMEQQINALPDVDGATITFATKQLRLSAKNYEAILPTIQRICTSIESEVKVVSRESHTAATVTSDEKKISPLVSILFGAALFVGGRLWDRAGLAATPSFIIYVIAYILLGGRILLTAAKNILKGQIFDENFLMSIATLGAFAIHDYAEAVGVMLFFRVGEFFEEKAVERSRSQIMDAVDMRPEVVNLVAGDEVQVIPAGAALVGDILLVRPGDRIPLDGVIVEGETRIDTAPITGEPVPVKAVVGDTIISGCVNTSGLLKMRVEKPLSESMVTRILDSVENAAASKPKIDRFITRFARIYTPVVVALAVGTAVIPSLITGNWQEWIYTALTFLIMSCPCALVLSVPLAFFCGIGSGSKKGILFKGGVSLEALQNVTTVVMDKTGTVTEGNFILQEIIATNGMSSEQLLLLAAGCEQTSTHPIAVSIVAAAKAKGLELEQPKELKEISGHGIWATMNDDEILCGNPRLMELYGVDISAYQKASFGAEILLAVNGVFAGHMVVSDTLKKDAKASIAQLKKAGITTVMLTGDEQNSAQAIADAAGIDEVYARLLPQDKVDHLVDIRKRDGSVMFVGDGINDAPVLASADVGAAMGSGADAAIEAADVVYMTSNMEAIPQSLAIAKATGQIALQNVVFALAIKVIVMILGLLGFASMWLAVFADTGVAFLCILNSVRILYKK